MSDQVQLPSILRTLSLEGNEQENEEAFTLGGVMPSEVASATQFKSYVCYGIAVANVETKYAGQEFNLAVLEENLKTHCKDYSDPIGVEPSKAVEFATKILFEVGPQIRTEKKTKADKVVKFVFPYTKTVESKKTLSLHTVFVSTFKDSVFTGDNTAQTLVITFKQAGILATKVMNKVAGYEYIYERETKVIFTPLAGAIFSKDDIAKISSDTGIQAVQVVKMINASSCSGGQHLYESTLECAIAATISATRKMTDKNARDSILAKMVKQYTRKHKVYNEGMFEFMCKYALEGVPAGLDS